MGHKVLILDDDADFNSLLTDIFEQADYDVTSSEDPLEAVEIFRDNDFDIVVTDFKMPGMSGAEFMTAIMKIRRSVPVIMVSGYLENETIRDLIREGVGGVFLKPLNIFSLLERTAELIEDASRSGLDSTAEETEDEVSRRVQFRFHSFPCKSDASTEFAEQLYRLRGFKSALTMNGLPGTHFRTVCEDLRAFDGSGSNRFYYMDASNFSESEVLGALADSGCGASNKPTFVIESVDAMSDAQKDLVVQLSKHKAPFDEDARDVRLVFCVYEDVDSLYDRGAIGENLYILMGISEIQVPSLVDCKEDLPLMAQGLAEQIARELGLSVPRFDRSAQQFVKEQAWPGGYAELEALMREVVKPGSAGTIHSGQLSTALAKCRKPTVGTAMEAELNAIKASYLGAVRTLFEDDPDAITNYLSAESVAAASQQV